MPPSSADAPGGADRDWLLQRKRAVSRQLSHWRLLLATADLRFALLLQANLLDTTDGDPPQRLLGIAHSGGDLEALLPAEAADVLLLCQDFLHDGPALPVLGRLLQRPSPPTVLLSLGTPHRVAIRAAREAGVQALISRQGVGRGVVLEALQQLSRGRPFMDAGCRAVLDDTTPASAELSARELEILALVAEGCSNRTIAGRLGIAEVTARDHVQNILSKLQVADRTAAAVAGLRLGYLR